MDIGDKVIVRSNEDDPLLIGHITSFTDFGNPKNDLCPIVEDEETKEEFICMGIVKPYSEGLLKELEPLTPKEQWNLLSKNYKRS